MSTNGRTVVVDTYLSPFSKLKPVPITSVKLTDGFWAPRIRVLADSTLPAIYSKLEESGAISNFKRIRDKTEAEFRGYPFADEHVYKWLEATLWLLSYEHDEFLKEKVLETVDLIRAVQEPDGYINTRFHGKREERYKNLKWSHELYVGGHLIQAAIAGKRSGACPDLLNVAIKYANHLLETFGPGKLEIADGHPEIEIALPELYRETRDQRYLELTEFFIDIRGRGHLDSSPYFVDNKPFKQLEEAPPGAHAVRFFYLVTGAADVYLERGDDELWSTLNRLWNDVVHTKMYVTGGVGSRSAGEAIGMAYELPNDTAYAETCASVASIMWNYRMLLATGDAKYADIMELTLYNGALSGISLDGKNFFYTNPLADRGKHRRQPWFPCPCCPPNIARLLASLSGYFYSISSNGIWVHLYASNETTVEFRNKNVHITQKTQYPWNGRVELTVTPDVEDEFALHLRVPGWTTGGKVYVNGRRLDIKVFPSSFMKIERVWEKGDTVRLDLEMPVKLIAAHPLVISDTARVAIKRGPIVYCLEQADNPDLDVWNIALSNDVKFESKYDPNLLGGVTIIEGDCLYLDPSNVSELYTEFGNYSLKSKKARFKAIPYYAWANREPGSMTVWIPLIDFYQRTVVPTN